MIDAVNAALGAMGILAQVAIVVLAVAVLAAWRSARARAALVGSWDGLSRQALWAGFAVAAVATGGSLYFSEIAGYIPCPLCWHQRIAMYPLTVILGLGALLGDRRAGLYGLIFPLVGMGVSARHIYIEVNPAADTCTVGAPCSVKWIEEYGYVTIPVLAATAFVLIAMLCVVSAVAGRRAAREERSRA